MTHFIPAAALVGGAPIGLAAALLWIAGISGIVGRPTGRAAEWPWRLAFLAGQIAAVSVATAGCGVVRRYRALLTRPSAGRAGRNWPDAPSADGIGSPEIM